MASCDVQSDCFELELTLKSRNNRSFVSFCYPCLSRRFSILAPQMNASPTSRALEAWDGFSKKLITPKPLISPFSKFYSITLNVLGILMCKKRGKKLRSFLVISICLQKCVICYTNLMKQFFSTLYFKVQYQAHIR